MGLEPSPAAPTSRCSPTTSSTTPAPAGRPGADLAHSPTGQPGAMAADIAAAQVDVVLVSLHKGVGHTPAVLAMYERPIARAAVDAGAHAVVRPPRAHHAGHRGLPGPTDLPRPGQLRHRDPRAHGPAERPPSGRRGPATRVELYGFAPDPAMPDYPFHPESRNTAIAAGRRRRRGDGRLVPCWIDDEAARARGRAEGGEQVAAYVRRSRQTPVSRRFAWDGDEVSSSARGRAR